MLDEKLYLETIKTLTLSVLGLQEDFSAVAAALRKRGLLDRSDFLACQKEMREANRARRERIEKLDSTTLRDFLKDFGGSIQ